LQLRLPVLKKHLLKCLILFETEGVEGNEKDGTTRKTKGKT